MVRVKAVHGGSNFCSAGDVLAGWLNLITACGPFPQQLPPVCALPMLVSALPHDTEVPSRQATCCTTPHLCVGLHVLAVPTSTAVAVGVVSKAVAVQFEALALLAMAAAHAGPAKDTKAA